MRREKNIICMLLNVSGFLAGMDRSATVVTKTLQQPQEIQHVIAQSVLSGKQWWYNTNYFTHNSGLSHSLAWCSQKNLLAIGACNNKARIVNMQTGQITVIPHEGSVGEVAWSLQGHMLATRSDKKARIFDVQTGQITVIPHNSKVESIAWNSLGYVATRTADNKAHLIDPQTGQVGTIDDKGISELIAWCPQGHRMAVRCLDDKVRIINIQTGQITVLPHEKFAREIVWCPQGNCLAIISGNKISVIDAQTSLIKTVIAQDNNVLSVTWCPQGQLLATTSFHDAKRNNIFKNKVNVFEVHTGQLKTVITHDSDIHTVAWDSQGHMLATGSSDKTARITDVQTGQVKTVISCWDKEIVALVARGSGGDSLICANTFGAKLFTEHKNYTLEQLLLKNALSKWLLIEKPNKAITTKDQMEAIKILLADVKKKCELELDVIATWNSFPLDMQNALYRTAHHRIVTYGATRKG